MPAHIAMFLAPKIEAWAKDKTEDVVLRRVPAIVGAPWADQARAYYTAEKTRYPRYRA